MSEHPHWAAPPFPDRPPTRAARALIRSMERVRRYRALRGAYPTVWRPALWKAAGRG